MDGDRIDEVKELLLKLAVIAEQVDARSRGALQRIEAGAATLDRSAQQWNADASQFAQHALATIGVQTRETVAEGSRQALANLDAQLRRSAESANWAAEALAEQRKLLTLAQRGLVWKGLLALLLGSLLAAGVSGYLLWRAAQAQAQPPLGAELSQAVRSGALVRCSDGHALCVRIGRHPQRSGSQGEYLVVQP